MRRDSNVPNLENGTPGAQGRPKRKAAAKQSKPEDYEDYEDEEGVEERSSQVQKKRRTGVDTSSPRSRLLKGVVELEGAIKKFQSSSMRDLAKLQQFAQSLASEIRAMDGE